MQQYPTITELVKNNSVNFHSYRAGNFYYDIAYGDSPQTTYRFTVPLEDIGDATLQCSDKALLFMRWIRKALETNTLTIIN